MDSAKIAKIQDLNLIYDHEAIVIAYTWSKKSMPKKFDQPFIIMFIDMGLSYSSIFIVKFDKKGT